MADKRQSFLFRFPWSRSSRSKEESKSHSTPKTQNPANSISKVVPDDRPPFRPAGKAPVKKATPLQAQETQNANASTSHAANESPKTLTPSRLSPSKKSHPPIQQSSPPSPPSSPQSQDHHRKIEMLSETDSSSEDSTSHKGIEISPSSDKSADTLIQLSGSETESKEHEEAKVAAHAPAAEDKTNGDTEPLQENINELHGADKDSTNQTNVAALQEEHQREKHEKETKAHAAITDSGQHTKDEAALQLDAEATDSENHNKEDLFRAALPAEQQHEKHERVTESHASSTTDSANHTKDEAALQERSSSSSKAEQIVPPPRNKETRDDISSVNKLAISSQMSDPPVGVITLTGENKGAEMHVSSEPENHEESVLIRHNFNLDQDDDDDTKANTTTTTTDQQDEQQERMMTCINSNVQSVNNSILCNSSVTEKSPGVTVCSFPPESIMNNEESESTHKTNKAQVVQTHADRLTHESTVRRRCLRGLFMESSDSEPDNPNKPRRHGCRYACGKQTKNETEVGIV